MWKVRVLLVCIALLAAGERLYAMDRATVIATLEQLIRTGEPRHVTHDAGEELWIALQPMLRDTADGELQSLARRAACPIVPDMFSPIGTPIQPLRLAIRASRVLPLPQLPSSTVVIEASADNMEWAKAFEFKGCTGAGAALDAFLPPAALAPGFHVLALRARISYPRAEERDEVRELPTLPYGVVGATWPVLTNARTVPVNVLDATLPAVPLSRWIAQFTAVGMEQIVWCNQHGARGFETEPSDAVCIVMTLSRHSGATFGELWLQIGELAVVREGARWSGGTPSLVEAAVFSHGRFQRSQVSLGDLPSLIGSSSQPVPRPIVVITPSDMTVEPPIPVPGQSATVRVNVWNTGSAPAVRVTIDVMAGSSADDVVLHRRFVRTIATLDRVQLELPAVFPQPYGWIMVMAGQYSEDSESSWMMSEGAVDEPLAIAFINRAAMPPPLIAVLCRNAVGNYRCGS